MNDPAVSTICAQIPKFGSILFKLGLYDFLFSFFWSSFAPQANSENSKRTLSELKLLELYSVYMYLLQLWAVLINRVFKPKSVNGINIPERIALLLTLFEQLQTHSRDDHRKRSNNSLWKAYSEIYHKREIIFTSTVPFTIVPKIAVWTRRKLLDI